MCAEDKDILYCGQAKKGNMIQDLTKCPIKVKTRVGMRDNSRWGKN